MESSKGLSESQADNLARQATQSSFEKLGLHTDQAVARVESGMQDLRRFEPPKPADNERILTPQMERAYNELTAQAAAAGNDTAKLQEIAGNLKVVLNLPLEEDVRVSGITKAEDGSLRINYSQPVINSRTIGARQIGYLDISAPQ